MKKLISLILCLCLMAGLVPAFAENAAADVKTPMRESLEKLDGVSRVEVIQPAEGSAYFSERYLDNFGYYLFTTFGEIMP